MTYNWETDAIQSWRFFMLWKSITKGFRRPSRPLELYWAEAAGTIP
jgi:hypothetical protein